MKKEINFKLYGTVSFPRAIITLVNQKIISMNDLSWYFIFVVQADFGHMFQTHGIITSGDSIIARELGCDPTTVNKKRNKLIRIGLLKTNTNLTEISNYRLFSKPSESLVTKIIDPIVKISNSILIKSDQKTASDYFLNKELYMKICQDFTESQRLKLLEKL